MLNITPIANNVIIELDFDADLAQNQYVWRALESGFQDYEIFFFDGTKTIQISNNQTNEDYTPKVSNGQVVWYQYNGSDAEIFFYDGTKTIQLTDNTANDESPQISNGQILWYQFDALPETEDPDDSEPEIYLYNRSQTIRVTDNEVNDRNAQFYGSQIVWESLDAAEKGGDYEILLYNNGQTQRLTDNQTYDSLKIVEGNYILWTSFNQITFQDELFVYDGIKTLQLTANGFDNYSYDIDTDGQNIVWLKNNDVYLYDGNNTQQITNDGVYKSNVQVSGNKIVWLGDDYSNGYDTEVFLYDGSTTTQLTNNDFYKTNLLVDGENIVWQVDDFDYINYTPNNDIYIYRNGAVSLLVGTNQNEKIISLSGNQLVGAIDDPNGYYRSVDQLFIATWTDDTFPILENPDQYGASYTDLIETYGYNLDGFSQHYRQFGIAEDRSLDSFDEFGYLASNTDLIDVYGADGKAATRHYIEHGYSESRPLDTFKADQYIASHEDLIYAFGGYDGYYGSQAPDLEAATRHYVESGYNEGRATDSFDELSYLTANPDLIEVFGSNLEAATKHYIQHGFYELYYRPLTFDASNYLAANTDLIDVLGSDRTVATQHYIASGYDEGRLTDSFDPLQYIASYDDLIVNFNSGGDAPYTYNGINIKAATDHFVDVGYQENRAIDTFDEYRYIASNIDLIYAYGGYYIDAEGTTAQATAQYIQYGITENRPTTSFDPFAYMQANSDVAQAYQNDPNLATLHYIRNGYFEGRSPAPGVDPF